MKWGDIPRVEYRMSDELAVPAKVPPVMFTDEGEEVFLFEASDFGNQPDWTKESLDGEPILIRGLSQDFFEGDFGQARSILYNVRTDTKETEPWGMFFQWEPNQAPIFGQIEKYLKRGGRFPFIAVLRSKKSEAHKGQAYWILEPYKKDVTPTGKGN